MHAPSPTDAELSAEASDAAWLERLEFGKYCVSPDGPVERDRNNILTGYSQLGRTRGFPEQLVRFCDPNTVGISEGEHEALPDGCPHGTVLRPVALGGGRSLRRIFYRVRMRPEEGEGKPGRKYTLARYTLADDDVDPLTLFEVMDSERLRGMGRAEASDLSPLGPAAPAESGPSALVEAFMREAPFFLLSGIPISVTDEIPERDFFGCVAALWHNLPPVLRVHLSAGWGVGGSFSGRLAVTYTTRRAGDSALFSASDYAWSPPDYVTLLDANYQPYRKNFFDERLEPARFYAEHVFGDLFNRAVNEWPASLSPDHDKVLSLTGSPPEYEFPELPDWRQPLTVRASRYLGLKAADEVHLQVLRRWLDEGEGEDSPRLRRDARKFNYESSRLRALGMIVGALASPDSRARGDEALFAHTLQGKCPDSLIAFIRGAEGDAAARACLLLDISRRDTRRVLHSLAEAAGREQAEALPPDAVWELHQRLDESIQRAAPEAPADGGMMEGHALLLSLTESRFTSAYRQGMRAGKTDLLAALHLGVPLLKQPRLPAAYREWVCARRLDLVSAFASLPKSFGEEIYSKVIEISRAEIFAPSRAGGVDDAEALCAMVSGGAMGERWARTLEKLPRESRDTFGGALNQQWGRRDGDVVARRARLLTWFRKLGPKGNTQPLLCLEAGEPLSEAQYEVMRAEIEQWLVPDDHGRPGPYPVPLPIQVSARVIYRWPQWGGGLTRSQEKYAAVTAEWPRWLMRALRLRGIGKESPHPEIAEAAENIVIPRDDLHRLLKGGRVKSDADGIAQRYWDWAVRYTPNADFAPDAVDICGHLAHLRLPDTRTPPDRAEVETSVWVAQESGEASRRLWPHRQQLWDATVRGWHVMLLLRLFPDAVFRPSAVQLGQLARWYQDWLKSHLDEWRGRGQTYEEFYVATVPFHRLSFRSDHKYWRHDFTRSVIWAAFHGVPTSDLRPGDLKAALEAYCPMGAGASAQEQARQIVEHKARMCLDYLRGHMEPQGSRTAWYRVLFEFVIPKLAEDLKPEDVADAFAFVGAGMPDYKERSKKHYRLLPTMEELMNTLIIHGNRKLIEKAIEEHYRRR